MLWRQCQEPNGSASRLLNYIFPSQASQEDAFDWFQPRRHFIISRARRRHYYEDIYFIFAASSAIYHILIDARWFRCWHIRRCFHLLSCFSVFGWAFVASSLRMKCAYATISAFGEARAFMLLSMMIGALTQAISFTFSFMLHMIGIGISERFHRPPSTPSATAAAIFVLSFFACHDINIAILKAGNF